MKSGMLAAETAFSAISSASESEVSTDTEVSSSDVDTDMPAVDMSPYESAVNNSWIYKELHEVRNLRPSFHNPLGLWGGMAYSGLDSLILKGRTPWTLRNKVEDHEATKKAR
jgi:electron-transferring-flavoprotein dehydrogenase